MTHTPTDYNQRTLDEALDLAQLGIRIVPIKPGEKRPPMPAWQEAATTNESTIRKWYEGQYRGYGLGVATGELANGKHLFVLDIDEHDPAVSGSDTLHDLERENGKLPDTVEVHTGSGGKHLYFLSDTEIRNDAGKKLGPGLDIRGHNGQVLAPPTLHPNGERYLWAYDQTPWDIEIANAPQWLIDRLIDTPRPTAAVIPAQRDQFLTGDSIADTYNAETTWTDILTQDGWQLSHIDHSGEHHWTRPGKTTREGTSATTNYQNRDVLKVFTSSIPWLPEGAYSRFQYFSRRHHDADMSKAAKALLARGLPSHSSISNFGVSEEWGELIPLIDEVKKLPFPLETLPQWVSDYAKAVAHDLQVSVDLPANLALGAISVCVLGNSTVTYQRQNWTQPLNLYMAVALPPSAGKSPAKNAMFSALEDLEQQRIVQANAKIFDFEADKRIREKDQRAKEEKAAKSKGADREMIRQEVRELSFEIAKLTRPISGKMMVDDITTEALGVELADAGGRIAVVSAEGGLFDRIAGLYNNQIANMDLYLEGWGGGRYSVSRIGRPPILVPKANVCVITTIQPAVLDAIGARRDFSGRGLTARFLLTIPDSNVGRRIRTLTSTTTPNIQAAYESSLIHIANEVSLNPVSLDVGEEASRLFAQWDQWLEDSLAPGEPLEHMAEWIGKLRASVLRIAGLLHLAHGKRGQRIDVDVMSDAIVLGRYFLAHSQAIATRWGTDGRVMQAQQIVEWIERTGRTEFTARELQRSNGRLYTSVEETRAPLELLVERGWIRPLFSGPFIFGGRGVPSPRFAVRHVRHLESDISRTLKVSDVSDVSPKHVLEEDLFILNTEKETRVSADTSDSNTESTHWSGLF
jgi:replicative DNA helicase